MYEKWLDSPHAKAYDTLTKAARQHDPECVVCHVVGYGDVSGFSRPDKKPDLRGVGCENCHGPGYKHYKDPEESKMAKDTGVCATKCHVADHSPNFDLPSYWEKVSHPPVEE